MVRVSPVKPDVDSTFVFIIFVYNIGLIVEQVVGVLISPNKLPLEYYFYVISLYPPGEYDTFFIDGDIGMF